jgi:hypothetical protein
MELMPLQGQKAGLSRDNRNLLSMEMPCRFMRNPVPF